MSERRRGRFSPREIPGYFQSFTEETRLRLEKANTKDVQASELLIAHAKAIEAAIAKVMKFYRDSMPTDVSTIHKYMIEEVNAVWSVQKAIDSDAQLVRRFHGTTESMMSLNLRRQWSHTLDELDMTIEHCRDAVRAALGALSDASTTWDTRVAARKRAIMTLGEIGKRWSAVVTKLTTAQKMSNRGKAS
jgi:hypothetical protein